MMGRQGGQFSVPDTAISDASLKEGVVKFSLTREFNGRHYVMETALVADESLVKAWKADAAGNLVFRKTARNFNPACAMAGKVCIAEVEEIVEVGAIDPDHVHLPGIYVDRLVLNPKPEKRIEQRTTRT
jgi:3-oxoacid CoA-transferase subunit A